MTDIRNIPISMHPKIKTCIAYVQSQSEPVSFADLARLVEVSPEPGTRDRLLLAQALACAEPAIWRHPVKGGSHPVFGHGPKPIGKPTGKTTVAKAAALAIPPEVVIKAMNDCERSIRDASAMFAGLGVNSSDLLSLCGGDKRLWLHVRDGLASKPGFRTLGRASCSWRYVKEASE